jgi:DNA-binding Xre family transcriptional regulator
MAARCGFSEAHYQNIDSGRQRRATPAVLGKIAAALGCAVEDLLE